jgi:hypothetical protein
MRLNETHRLAIECSRSIESVLHNELLLWQAIDTLAVEQSGEPYPRSREAVRLAASQLCTISVSTSDMGWNFSHT